MRVVGKAIKEPVRLILADPPETDDPPDPATGLGQETTAATTRLLTPWGHR